MTTSMVSLTTDIVENSISFDNRILRSKQFKIEYPYYIPMFIKYHDNDDIVRNLLHKDTHFSRLLFILRQRKKIKPSIAMMTLIECERVSGYVKSLQIPFSKTIGELADDYLHADGFLYINITVENVFG